MGDVLADGADAARPQTGRAAAEREPLRVQVAAALAGGSAGAVACLLMVLGHHWVRCDPLVGVNVALMVPAAAVIGSVLAFVLLAGRRPRRWERVAVPALFAVATGLQVGWFTSRMGGILVTLGGELRLALQRTVLDTVGDLAAELGQETSGLWKFLYCEPILTGVTAGLAMGFAVHGILSEPPTDWRRRARVYAVAVGAIALARVLVPPLWLLRFRPSLFTMGLRGWYGLGFLAWAAALDVGQALARTRPVRRCWREVVTAISLLALVLIGLSWRPIAAEYLFLRGHFETGRAHYRFIERAYRLAPGNERNAYAYATVLSIRGPDPWQDPAAALAIEQRAIQVFPKDPSHYGWAAVAAERLGLTEQALDYCRRAFAVAQERTPEDGRCWLAVGLSPANHGRHLMTALRAHGGEAGVTEIAAFLDSSDPALVAHAARTLAEMGESTYADRIEGALEHVTDPRDRTAIEEALQALRGGSPVPEAEAAGEAGG